MPLRATDKLEIYIFMSGAMVFYMIDENDKRRVRCSISDRALRQFEPRMEWLAMYQAAAWTTSERRQQSLLHCGPM